jgi:hypothetical protein
MKFARIVFWIASVWGVLVLTPLFFLFDAIGRTDPPAITHPGFYYGFAAVALCWQVVFMVIAANPIRFRPMMILAMMEKFSYATVVYLLFQQGRMHASDLTFAGTDFLLGVLFLISFVKTKQRAALAEPPAAQER